MRGELGGIPGHYVEGECQGVADRAEGLRVGPDGAEVVELEVVEADAAVVGGAGSEREAEEGFGGVEGFAFAGVPEGALEGGGDRHIFEGDGEAEVAGAGDGVERLDADLQARKRSRWW